ncbi:MAG: LON peptidase substrate-binding domain-containing protein [Magnetovibrio sp.]|nr:LON peptidase substrate-binding domain-containing protein [Magnetovibrio sp.]
MAGFRNPFELPKQLPIFPLSGAVLMPFGHLPLNVYEPRYIHMIDDALGQGRVVGMIQPRKVQGDPVPDDAELYDIGTVGRIIQFADPGDGRYVVTLEGLMRFRVEHCIEPEFGRGYRRVMPNYSTFEHDLNPNENDDGPGRERLLELTRTYFGEQEIEADWEAVAGAPYEALVASLSMSCPFAPEEKQALLETHDHEDRAAMLISLFEMSADGDHDGTIFKH